MVPQVGQEARLKDPSLLEAMGITPDPGVVSSYSRFHLHLITDLAPEIRMQEASQERGPIQTPRRGAPAAVAA